MKSVGEHVMEMHGQGLLWLNILLFFLLSLLYFHSIVPGTLYCYLG